jgi:tetratricopeptide (TPR) repeat protein
VQSTEVNSGMERYRAELGDAFRLLGEGRPEQALERFERVLESAPRDEVSVRTQALRGKAAALRALGKTEAALTCLEQAQWVAPGNSQVLVDISEIIQTLDLSRLAGTQLLGTLRTIQGVAAALQRRGFCDRALALCDMIIERDCVDRQLLARTWATKGLSLRQSGFAQAALEWLDKALELDPGNRKLSEERAAAVAATRRVGRA